MAYSITESPIDYHSSGRYVQYTGLRKGSTRSDYDVPVASQHAIYNTAIEQQLDRNKDSRNPSRAQKVSSQPITHAPSIATVEQRSRSLDQGKPIQDLEFIGTKKLNIGQQEALKTLTEGTRIDNSKDKSHAEEVNWNTRFVRGGRPHHHASKSVPDDSSKPFSYGLPSNPRPDPYRQIPSLDTTEVRPLWKDDTPVVPQIHDQTGYPEKYHKKPSYPYSEQNSSLWKGGFDSRKGSSTSGREEKNHPVTLLPIVERIPAKLTSPTRKVKITCDQISFTFSFTPSSTAKDVLNMARDRLGEGFDIKRYTLVESYRQLGSERPLRHFERISDILDSWDSDDKDSLLIQPLHAQWEHESLDLENAPKLVPSNMTASLYYSHRPESWHKWAFTLRVDGQIVMQKYNGGDFKAVCHMKDCDIYVPTSRQMKKLAPPRKFCFAIKSQQKSTSFSDASNFVHFFSTSDKEVASEWYRAVHGWRSYYLVHTKEMQQAQPTVPSASTRVATAPQRNASLPRGTQRKDSTDKPLPKLDQLSISTSVGGGNSRTIQGYASFPQENIANTTHNRSISADRERRHPPNHIRGLSESTEIFATRTYTHDGHIIRKASAPTRSGSVPLAAQGLLLSRVTPQNSFTPSANGVESHGHVMRKQTLVPGSVADPLPAYQHSHNKPLVDTETARKFSDDASSNVHPGMAFPQPEWKFDPYTGQPIISIRSKEIATSKIQASGPHQSQASAIKDMYITMEPTDRKFSGDSPSGYFVPVHQGLKQDYPAVNDIRGLYRPAVDSTQPYNHLSNQPWVDSEPQGTRGLYLPPGRTYDAMTTTSQRYF